MSQSITTMACIGVLHSASGNFYRIMYSHQGKSSTVNIKQLENDIVDVVYSHQLDFFLCHALYSNSVLTTYSALRTFGSNIDYAIKRLISESDNSIYASDDQGNILELDWKESHELVNTYKADDLPFLASEVKSIHRIGRGVIFVLTHSGMTWRLNQNELRFEPVTDNVHQTDNQKELRFEPVMGNVHQIIHNGRAGRLFMLGHDNSVYVAYYMEDDYPRNNSLELTYQSDSLRVYRDSKTVGQIQSIFSCVRHYASSWDPDDNDFTVIGITLDRRSVVLDDRNVTTKIKNVVEHLNRFLKSHEVREITTVYSQNGTFLFMLDENNNLFVHLVCPEREHFIENTTGDVLSLEPVEVIRKLPKSGASYSTNV